MDLREKEKRGEDLSVKGKVIYGGIQMRNARLKAGIGSQKELADRAGISPNIISDLERGQRLIFGEIPALSANSIWLPIPAFRRAFLI